MSAGEQGKFRYLICTDASQVEAAAAIAGKSYKCISLESAKNGHLAEVSGNPIVLWPSKDDVAIARAWGRELAVFGEVKLLDVSKGFCPTPQEMVAGEWDFKQMLDWISGKTEHSTNIVELVTANIDEQNSASPDDNLPSVEVDPATDDSPDAYGSPAEAPDGLGEAEPTWMREWPPDDDTGPPRPLSAEVAYTPYTPAETRSEGQDWPEPLDLTRALYRGLPMPENVIPAPLRAFIADAAARLGTERAPVLFGALGAIAGVCSDSIRLQVKQHDSWTVHPSIWPICIGAPSTGKSPAIELSMRFIQQIDAAAVVKNAEKMKNYKHQYDIWLDECAAARKNKLPLPQGEPELPTLREYWMDSGTKEGAVRMLQHSRKILRYTDEISSFLTTMDRYAQGGKGSGDREFWLSCYNGGNTKVTLASKTVSIENASVVVVGGTTPSAMQQAAGGKLQSDGLLARMLVCMVHQEKTIGEDAPPDGAAIALYQQILETLIDIEHSATLRLSPDAATIYREFCDWLTVRMRDEDSPQLAGALGKWFGTWPRLALIYTMIDLAAHGQAPIDGQQVSADIARQVSDFMRWNLTHQQEFYHEIMNTKAGRSFAQIISKYILANDELETLVFRDHIARPHWGTIEKLKPWEIKEGVNTLINAAWITPIGLKTNSYGVAGSFQINPKIRSMFDRQRQLEKERRAIIREELQAMRGLREPGED